MEPDYDYSYFEVSSDSGATWTKLPDMDGVFVTDGNGFPALNGEGQGTLRFDLAAYAGKKIALRLHYTSDVGVQLFGWFADDFKLADGATTLFSDDVENPPNGWTTNHFVIVPLTRTFPLYYMAEWRNNSGFDRGLKYPYTTIYNNPDDERVAGRPHPVHRARHAAVAAQRGLRLRLPALRLHLRPAQLRAEARHARGGQPLLALRVEHDGLLRRTSAAERPRPAGQRHLHAAEDHPIHREPV